MLSSSYPPTNTLQNTLLLFYLRSITIFSHSLIFKSLSTHFPCFIHLTCRHNLQHYSSFYLRTNVIMTFLYFLECQYSRSQGLSDEVSPPFLTSYQRAARVLQTQVLVRSAGHSPASTDLSKLILSCSRENSIAPI